ncbi:hypothetical protein CHLNCDRAFT_138729 [Chlorella variabilis]|uniref:Rieske domain-containing protein n=1 Tax=Chlorella variabilis TaxID=554065 RepID=E1ZNM8_CHLVA|nr:hypothetical protein CHLNCDRAFT_138729 [Chlorella variabilis]EFN52711.1 hypothetical protein CHLNCDRAFT_138729 [Chlorella variabilis]|eukprot:XP_005844813.1 hypothetical protein CHLNCDRAFT_138729 [Chlorella variabilis]
MQAALSTRLAAPAAGPRSYGSSDARPAACRCLGQAPRRPAAARSSRSLIVTASRQQAEFRGSQQPTSLVRSASSELDARAPFLDPFLRTFFLGVGMGALLEGGHVALQVLSGTFPGTSHFAPLLFADHVTALASWIGLYAVEAAAVMAVLKRFNYDPRAAARDIAGLMTPSKKMLPLRLTLFKQFFAAGAKLAAPSSALAGSAGALPQTPSDRVVQPPTKARGANSVVPAPPSRRPTGLPPLPEIEDPEKAAIAKRLKELRDREGYLKNMWYAAALSSNVGKEPVKTLLCGKEMVLFRQGAGWDEQGKVHAIDNTCPHRGAPLSEGWVEHKNGHSCVVCPYHGWAMDGEGHLQDVPAAANKGEWPKRPIVDSWPVEEKGGFVWLFYGSKALPADARPPIPYSKPEIRDMSTTTDEHSITATFTVYNKPVNAFWALFQVPEVHVTAKAFLPSTSLVTFELGNGLNFTTFVSTCPISANKTVNRFALVRKLSSDKTGIFNSRLWDGMARSAMLKIQREDKEMVEQLKYDQLPAEYSVRADLPQIMFRKLRQQYVDMGYGVPSEQRVAPFASNPMRDQ